MPTKEEYAVMSVLAYGETLSPNDLAAPMDWSWTPYSPESANGLQYSVFVRGAEIVIAYAGTEPNDPEDLLADLAGAAGYPFMTQVFAAAQVYAEVRRDYPNVPEQNISFTGHSLGGGLRDR